MPNWCSNEVSISGKPEVIKQIADIIKNNPDGFEMDDFVPMPEHLRETTSGVGGDSNFMKALNGDKTVEYDNWYHWSLANWGTKWDVSEAQVSYHPSGTSISIGYQTAWSPNGEFWTEFSSLHPVLIQHQYLEEGMCFIGETDYQDGNADDYCIEISSEMYKEAGAILDDEGNVDWDKSADFDLFDIFPLRKVA